jgi:hypothetical protein
MSKYWLGIITALLVGLAAHGANEPWRELYRGEQATGEQVIALWQFQAGAEAEDSSGRGHKLTLRGNSRFVSGGLFGSCLESFASENDAAHGAQVKNHPALTPKGAFTIELWLKPKPEFATDKNSFLVDKQYHRKAGDPGGNKDFELSARPLGDGKHLIDAWLGHGEETSHYNSAPVSLPVGEWTYLAFSYDGAGTGRFFVNGQRAGERVNAGRGTIAAGPHPLVIGSRVGSSYIGCAAFLSQVRIMNGTPAWLAPQPTAEITGGRTVFLRQEPEAKISVTIKNTFAQPLQGLQATVSVAGVTAPPLRTAIREVAANGQLRADLPVEVSLKPGEYNLTIRFSGKAGNQAVTFATAGKLTIVPRPLPRVFPVVDWGIPETSYKVTDYESLKEIGFTHTLFRESDVANFERLWTAGKLLVPSLTPDQTLKQLDMQLAAGLRHVVQLCPGEWVVGERGEGHEARQKQFRRVNRSGEPTPRKNVCGLFPEVQQYAFNVGASAGQTFGRHPALDGALIHSEIRDGSALCFHPHDRAAYRAASGQDIPAEANAREGVGPSGRRKHVPPQGLIADDHPLLDYYRWFWREGDGWNELHSQVHRGLKTGTHSGFWTFNDPAVRCPPIWGSGGESDVLSQWTYTYPDPPRIGLATDELFAMAAGRPGQQVMKMTQIIWYRNQTAPNLPEKEEDRAAWEKTEPAAPFITIAPDHLREAFWLKLSRPVQGIMYHGDPSLGMGPKENKHSYRYTNPETRKVLGELIHQYATPLGPTLMQVPDPPAEVAMLESFTSMIFGAAQTWGWGGSWVGDMHLILQWARLQPQIVYEETILRDKLEGIKVLVMPNCTVLPRGVYQQILAFQRRGGIVVGDQYLAPAITPDVIIPHPGSVGEPDRQKAALQGLAAQLRRELAPVYAPRLDSSDPDVLVRRRQYRDSEYVFVINDKRTYGKYVGHHRLVMEQGLPHQATISLSRTGGAMYDLLASQAVTVTSRTGRLQWPTSLGPGEGRVYLVTPRPIAAVQVQVAQRRPADRLAAVQVRVVDAAAQPLAAVVPVKMDILDPTGAAAEFSGHYGAQDGVIALKLDLAPNDTPGTWTIRARELASGKTAEAKFVFQP